MDTFATPPITLTPMGASRDRQSQASIGKISKLRTEIYKVLIPKIKIILKYPCCDLLEVWGDL
jgi:hypothetical protein